MSASLTFPLYVSLTLWFSSQKRVEVDKLTQKLVQESTDRVREVTLGLTAEIDREREVSRELRIRLIAEEDKIREVKREVAIVREEMELRGKQQLEMTAAEKRL
jgi:LPS O-antigen subunit length determinant protein (WzzB/FepE family)